MILGIDEVGRGAWAGPLVMGAVVLGGKQIDGLTDSKLLTKQKREALYEEIYTNALGIGLGWVWPSEIDEIGLGPALRLATKRAVKAVNCTFHGIVIDGTVNFLSGTALEPHVTTMKKADLLMPSVSAASIVAKVARDRYMAEQDASYPDFKFAAHVGYGTAAHRLAINHYGVTPLHRLGIAPLRVYDNTRSSKPVREQPTSEGTTTRHIGDLSETAAAEALMRDGHEILERNWKTKWCEIDIVSRKEKKFYFVEVKHRKNSDAGDGLAAITPKKLSQMKFAAEVYVQKYKLQGYDRQLMAVATTGDPAVVTDMLEIV